MRLEYTQQTLRLRLSGSLQRYADFCRMMRIIINNPDTIDFTLGFKTTFGTAELFQGCKNFVGSNAHLMCSSKRAHRIQHIMSAGNNQMNLCHKFSLVVQLVAGAVNTVGNITSNVVSTLAFYAVGNYLFIGFGSQTAYLGIIKAKDCLAAFLDVAYKLFKSLIYIFFCTVMIQMIIFNISYYSKIRIQLEEGAVAFIRLRYHKATCAVARITAKRTYEQHADY